MFHTGRALLALVACALVGACDDAPSQKPAEPGTPRKAEPKGASLPGEMVSAVSASKSSLIISVHFALGAQPAVGKPLPVDIAVVPHRPFASVRAHFDSPDGLKVTSGTEMAPLEDVAEEKVLSHKIELTPLREGVFMVTAAIETQSDEGTITRLYSIPVIVNGNAGPRTAPPATPPPSSDTPGG
jgi:hypothetical protein